jgi:hypothetical protein
LVHFFIGSLNFESLVFWAPYIFCFLIHCHIYSWQRFSPILWATSSIWWPCLFCMQKLFNLI